jgi:hypothetical protein
VSGEFGLFGVRSDLYGSDTCHHSQGDTWQDDVSIMTWQADRAYDRLTWQMTRQYGRLTCQMTWRKTWTNQMLTRVMLSVAGKCATWPSQGLPRGTPLLVD